MDVNVLKDIVENVKDKPNKTLITSRDFLHEEFNKTKELIIDLTRHLDAVGSWYDTVNNEIGKRKIK
jgi:hypothetical protein